MTDPFVEPTTQTDPRLAQIEQAIAARDIGLAVKLAEEALAGGAAHPLLFNLRALRAEDEGRLTDSLADLERARALAPGDISVLNALGLCLTRLGRHEEAIDAFEQATGLAADFTQAWNNRGIAELQLGRLEEARRSFETASALQPGFAEPRGHLALMAARRGDRDEARSAALAALAIKPRLREAVQAMAEVELAEGDLTGAERRLRELLGDPTLGPYGRYYAQGLLGDVLDRQDRIREAFDAYQTANQVHYRTHAAQFGRHGLTETVIELHQAFRDLGPAGDPVSPPPETSPASQHIFLIGFMRSGTTLMEQVLASVPGAVSLEEKEALVSGVNAYMSGAEGMRRLAGADQAELAVHRADYWERVRRFGVEPAGRVFVDKMPLNGMKLPLIQRLFPEASIVFSIRDPRDVIFSCFKHRFAVTSHTYPLLTLPTAVRFYDAYMAGVETYRAALPLKLHRYRHEDLVGDFDGQVKALCDFLGVAWSEAMRDIGARSRRGLVASPSAPQLLSGLSSAGVQQWRRYETELAPYYGGLRPWVDAFGYE